MLLVSRSVIFVHLPIKTTAVTRVSLLVIYFFVIQQVCIQYRMYIVYTNTVRCGSYRTWYYYYVRYIYDVYHCVTTDTSITNYTRAGAKSSGQHHDDVQKCCPAAAALSFHGEQNLSSSPLACIYITVQWKLPVRQWTYMYIYVILLYILIFPCGVYACYYMYIRSIWSIRQPTAIIDSFAQPMTRKICIYNYYYSMYNIRWRKTVFRFSSIDFFTS